MKLLNFSSRRRLRHALLAIILASLFLFSCVAGAFTSETEIPPIHITQTFQRLEYEIIPDPANNCQYDITMTLQAPVQITYTPPSLITFLLDGTDSMKAVDPVFGVSRDELARRGVIDALDTLMSEQDVLIKQRTFINIILFGSVAQDAVSFTRWAQGFNSPLIPPFIAAPTLSDLTDPNLSTVGIMDYRDFVPLLDVADPSGETLNPVLAGLLLCSDTISSGANISPIPVAQAAANQIADVYFFGNTADPGGPRSKRFPLSESGTTMNGGMRHAYESLKEASAAANLDSLNNVFNTAPWASIYAPLTSDEKALGNLNKYVLVLADGDDASNPATKSWAVALTIDDDSANTVQTFQFNNPLAPFAPLPAGATAALIGPKSGLGARIWTMMIDRSTGSTAETPNEMLWRSTFPGMPAGMGNMLSTMTRHMVSHATIIGDGVEFVNYNSAVLGSNITSDWNTSYDAYKETTKNQYAFPTITKYVRPRNVNEVYQFFRDFGASSSIVGGIKRGVVIGKIGADFDVDLSTVSATTNAPTSPAPIIDMQANGNFSLSLERMAANEIITLKYSIELKDQFKGDGALHETAEKMYIEYESMLITPPSSGSFVLNFRDAAVPIRTTCPDINTTPPPVYPTPTPLVTDPPTSPSPPGIGLVPAFTVPYSPQNQIVQETVEEGTETNLIDVANTGTSGNVLPIIIIVATLSSIAMLYFKRKQR